MVIYEKIRSREIDDYTVYHCVLSGEKILSREEFPCRHIPLIPVFGQEYYVNGKKEFRSLISQAKDAQRMYNYWKSASTEMIALQPKSPYIGPVGSFQSFPDKWDTAHQQNYPFIEYDIVHDESGALLPPPKREPPAQGSPALMQEALNARDDIRLGLGIPQSNMGERSNAISGIAIRNQQIEGDNATFHFIDNLSSSIAQVGRILDELIGVLYSPRKIARIIGEDDEEETIPVNTPFIEDDNGKRPVKYGETPQGIYDLNIGKYDIEMDVGPSYSSKRQETADKMTEIAKVRPDIMDVAGDLYFEALDLPLGKQIAERVKTAMPPEMLGDDPQAAKLQQAAMTLAQMQEQLANYEAALESKEKNEKFEQAAKAEELQLERDKFEVDAEKIKAEIAKTYAEIQMQGMEAASQNIDQIVGDVADLKETMSLILDNEEERLASPAPVNSGQPQEESRA